MLVKLLQSELDSRANNDIIRTRRTKIIVINMSSITKIFKLLFLLPPLYFFFATNQSNLGLIPGTAHSKLCQSPSCCLASVLIATELHGNNIRENSYGISLETIYNPPPPHDLNKTELTEQQRIKTCVTAF
jgi:hypothetical protein